jgi:phosphoglycolate phosphatase-like HAD superfamily hydrolase
MQQVSVTSNTLVLFDIDGTLLYSKNPILRQRFTHAVQELHGKTVEIEWEYMEGTIDNTILRSLMTKADVSEEDIEQSLPHAHEKAFEYFEMNVTEEYASSILPGAKELLDRLYSRVHLGVLTGNYEKTAMKKLSLVGLDSYIDFGMFGHEAEDRNALAFAVFDKAKEHFGKTFAADHVIFIGDTPKDIACARVIDAHIISVATGKYTKDELEEHNPDLLVSSLEDSRIVDYINEVHSTK